MIRLLGLPTSCRNKLLQIFPIFPLLTFCFRGPNRPEVCETFGKGSGSAERLGTGSRNKFVESLWKMTVNVTCLNLFYLFSGTFAEESEKVIYGLVFPIRTFEVLYVQVNPFSPLCLCLYEDELIYFIIFFTLRNKRLV